MAYIGSLLARGKFINLSLVKSCLQAVTNWCQKYVSKVEFSANNYASAELHTLFYCACQTIFYLVTFKHGSFFKNPDIVNFIKHLNLERLINSEVNPLFGCNKAVVDNFAAISTHFEIAPCYAVIEKNRRKHIPTVGVLGVFKLSGNMLDSLFPFEPIDAEGMLKSSAQCIELFYQDFEPLPAEVLEAAGMSESSEENLPEEDDNSDDFLD